MPKRIASALLMLSVASTALQARSKAQIVWMVANYGLAIADYESAIRAQRMPSDCHETNPLFGSGHPDRADFYLRGLALDTGLDFSSLMMRRCHHKWFHWMWMLPLASVTETHTKGTISNVRCK